MTKRLTDEELSRVLSHHAVGLIHSGAHSDVNGTACVAGAAMCHGGWFIFHPGDNAEAQRARAIFHILAADQNSPRTADEMLALLEQRGLA